ncbi:MAG TPA: hypothetical protein VFP11_00875, partial [Candidatus Angelobacter sp.]|nr:hypothetical protein [Candidatus Angelobacter sp.]
MHRFLPSGKDAHEFQQGLDEAGIRSAVAQTPIKIACLPHFAIYREYLTGYLEYTLASCSNVSHVTNVGGQAREQLSFVVLDLPNPHFRSDTKY